MSTFQFSASEREFVYPFQIQDNFLNACSLNYNDDVGFVTERSIILGDEEITKCVLKISVAPEEISDFFKTTPDKLRLSVIFKDSDLRRYEKFAEHSLDEINGMEIDLFSRLPATQDLSRLEIAVVLTNVDTDNPSTQFNKLSTKTFSFLSLKSDFDFKRVWKEPGAFEEVGLSPKTPWFLCWVGEDLDRPINDLVVLWLNSQHRIPIQTIGVSTNHVLVQNQMSATILHDIFLPILIRAIDQDLANEVAVNTVLHVLSQQLGIERWLIAERRGRPDFSSWLMSACLALVGMEKSLESLNG